MMAKTENKKIELITNESEDLDSDSDFEAVNLDQEIFLNPFHTVGLWTKELLDDVLATVKPDSHDRGCRNEKFILNPISFSKGSYHSQTVRVDHVMIPYSKENGYGQKYLYICLSSVLEEFITNAFQAKYLNIKPAKFQGREGEWWKTIYDFKDVFQVINKRQKSTPVSIRKIMRHTRKGVRANLVLEFSLCTRTDGAYWNNKMETTILVKAKTGYVTSIGVNIKPPTPLGSVPGKPMLQDTASDEILIYLGKFSL